MKDFILLSVGTTKMTIVHCLNLCLLYHIISGINSNTTKVLNDIASKSDGKNAIIKSVALL